MDWKQEAINKLKDLEVKKQALRSIPLERERLRCALEGIRASGVDGAPVRGSTTRREDRLLGCIVKLQELENTEKQAKLWVKTVSGALDALTDEERLLLDRLYVLPVKNGVNQLCEELMVEKSAVYYRRDKALRRFTLAMYGAPES
ncbi:MAG: hypothetical protein IJB17_06130 [Oscillospiraceae bacterium]|nr:hypothetical protein [Oscillospiraceae bacterium]